MRPAHQAMRLDQALVERGLAESRERAKRSILAGQVRVNQQTVDKCSAPVKPLDLVEVVAGEKYVSRGGTKLEHALRHFQVNAAGLTAMDVGASTGGFTDCLLQHGIARVYAVDVGSGQLAYKLRRDPRVVVLEKTNARQLTPAHFGAGFTPVDLAVVDCSFISLKKILPPVAPLVKPEGLVLALIKPQFEAGKAEADKGRGVITDPAIHARVVAELEHFVAAGGDLHWQGVMESPILGPAGNKEFLVMLAKA